MESPSTFDRSPQHRLHIIGNSCSGKSTLGRQLADALGVPFVELDAINWQPNWVGLNDTDPAEFERRIRQATADDAWVVAGSYMSFSQRCFWDRVQTVIWLDLPMRTLLCRVLRRSWKRWRTNELLWGTNYEDFWKHLKIWSAQESLITWIVTQHTHKRREMRAAIADPRWRHIRFVQRTSSTLDESLITAAAPNRLECQSTSGTASAS
jgi:adenylate kinase family enzyme